MKPEVVRSTIEEKNVTKDTVSRTTEGILRCPQYWTVKLGKADRHSQYMRRRLQKKIKRADDTIQEKFGKSTKEYPTKSASQESWSEQKAVRNHFPQMTPDTTLARDNVY